MKKGGIYCCRCIGAGSPIENVAGRDRWHNMNSEGLGPARLDKSSTNPAAIRGREQELIDLHGGAKSMGGTSGNKINGISPQNRNRQFYMDESRKAFGGGS